VTALVVQAHPAEQSYNAALLDVVVSQLPSAAVIRLGQEDALTAETFAGVTNLVVVYPTWWGSVPAALLGPLSEILGPWVDGNEPVDTSPLRSVEKVNVVTTHGSSRLINQLQGEPGRQLWKRVVLPRCAPGATFAWKSLYKMDRLNDQERRSFLSSLTI